MSITVHTAAGSKFPRQVSVNGNQTEITAIKEGKNWVIRDGSVVIANASKFREVEFEIAAYLKR